MSRGQAVKASKAPAETVRKSPDPDAAGPVRARLGMQRSRSLADGTGARVRRSCGADCGCPACTAAQSAQEAGAGDEDAVARRPQDSALQVHPKLALGAPDDPAERAADATADRVVRTLRAPAGPAPGPSPDVRRQAQEGGGTADIPAEIEPRIRRMQGGGEPLPAAVRDRMEPAFGQDLGHIRIHRDAEGAQTADAIGAQAYALGDHIAFNRGTYAPGTAQGDHLIAHELAHTSETGTVRRAPGGEWNPYTDAQADPSQNVSRAPAHMSDDALRDALDALTDEIATADAETSLHLQDEIDALEDEEYLRWVIDMGLARLNAMDATAVGNAIALLEQAQTADRPDQDQIMATLALLYRKEADPGLILQRVSKDAVKGIKVVWLVTLAQLPFLPTNARIVTQDVVHHGEYTLVPHSKEAGDGVLEIHYYLAFRNGTEENEYIVGPDSLSTFIAKADEYRAKSDANLTDDTPGDLIDSHTSYLNLDEDKLGKRLLNIATRHTPEVYDYVLKVFRKLDDGDRDDVALAFFESASNRQLLRLVSTPAGSDLVDKLYNHLVGGGGYVRGAEEEQGRRVTEARTMAVPVEKFAEDTENLLIFPFRMGGFTVYDDAPILAKRLTNGNVLVEMPVRVKGTRKFRAETDTLPDRVFTSGIELEPNRIVAVRNYEDGDTMDFVAAIGLVGYSGRGTTNVYNKLGEATAIGLTLGLGGAAAGTVGAVSWVARAKKVLDVAAVALEALSIVVSEHKGWIIKTFPNAGPKFVLAVQVANAAVALYGLGRVAVSGVKLVRDLRKARQDLRAAAARAGDEAGDMSRLQKIEKDADKFLDKVDDALEEQGLAPLGRSKGHTTGHDIDPEMHASLLASAGAKTDGAALTDAERLAEFREAIKGRTQKSSVPGYVDEVQIGNKHIWRRRADGTWCRFSKRHCLTDDELDLLSKQIGKKLDELGKSTVKAGAGKTVTFHLEDIVTQAMHNLRAKLGNRWLTAREYGTRLHSEVEKLIKQRHGTPPSGLTVSAEASIDTFSGVPKRTKDMTIRELLESDPALKPYESELKRIFGDLDGRVGDKKPDLVVESSGEIVVWDLTSKLTESHFAKTLFYTIVLNQSGKLARGGETYWRHWRKGFSPAR